MPILSSEARSYYSNKSRGIRKKEGRDDDVESLIEPDVLHSAFTKNRAQLIQKIYNADPLICAQCQGKMCIISFIEDNAIIEKILFIFICSQYIVPTSLTNMHDSVSYMDGEREMSAGLKVECYSGYKVNEKPLAFFLNKRRVGVKKIIDQWYGPKHTYFKILAEDENIYILKYSEINDHWELVFFKEGAHYLNISPEIWKNASSS